MEIYAFKCDAEHEQWPEWGCKSEWNIDRSLYSFPWHFWISFYGNWYISSTPEIIELMQKAKNDFNQKQRGKNDNESKMTLCIELASHRSFIYRSGGTRKMCEHRTLKSPRSFTQSESFEGTAVMRILSEAPSCWVWVRMRMLLVSYWQPLCLWSYYFGLTIRHFFLRALTVRETNWE